MTDRTEGGVTYTQTWNFDNKLDQVTWNGENVRFVYDGDGNRFLKIEQPSGSPQKTTLYLGRHYEVEVGTVMTPTKYYFHGDARVAMRRGGEVYYLHGDHLVSTSLTTDENGDVDSEERYLPYGGKHWIDGVSPTDFGFTAQRNEASFGLMDYNARYYSPGLGRFISPDTIVPEPDSSSGFNRYRYARNNPLKYTDPSGHCVGVALGMDTAACVVVGKILVDVAVVAVATYLIVDSAQEIGQTINDLPLDQVNPPVTSGGFEGEAQPPLTEEIPLQEGNQATVETVPANPPENSSILDPFERPANWPTEFAAIYEGMPYTHEQLREWGGYMPNRPNKASVGSEGFKNFIEDRTGELFIDDDWEYVMESWYLEEEDEYVENHYWRNKKTKETYHHD